MLINGILEVEEWLHNVAIEKFDTLDLLKQNNTNIGSIGMFEDVLYYRINETTVIPLISSIQLGNILSSIDFGDTVINNITNDIVNNTTFINTIIGNILTSIINNQEFRAELINAVISKANVEVQSLQGVRLFFAFDPSTLDELQKKPTLPNGTGTCSSPTEVSLIGNFNPSRGETLEYDISVLGSSDYLLTYTIVGGVINTPIHESPIQVTWDTEFTELASIGVGVGCSNDIINSKYDFQFFVLK